MRELCLITAQPCRRHPDAPHRRAARLVADGRRAAWLARDHAPDPHDRDPRVTREHRPGGVPGGGPHGAGGLRRTVLRRRIARGRHERRAERSAADQWRP